MPVRVYSSGMLVRLAFSIATSFDADILLMDEWLGVGDADFNARAQERLSEIVQKASILVLASHNKDIIAANCNRIMHLEHGQVTSDVPCGGAA
ncbi:Teichoic acids export ATP-binding protein TagH [compost metagenome]